MKAIKILDKKENMAWDHDEDADVLYISIGEPRKTLGIDIGEGAVLPVRGRNRRSSGITLIGIKERLLGSLKKN